MSNGNDQNNGNDGKITVSVNRGKYLSHPFAVEFRGTAEDASRVDDLLIPSGVHRDVAIGEEGVGGVRCDCTSAERALSVIGRLQDAGLPLAGVDSAIEAIQRLDGKSPKKGGNFVA